MIGKRFGRLEVIGFSHTEDERGYWKCRCDCGNETVVSGTSLRRGRGATKSCGCLNDIARRKHKMVPLLYASDENLDGEL